MGNAGVSEGPPQGRQKRVLTAGTFPKAHPGSWPHSRVTGGGDIAVTGGRVQDKDSETQSFPLLVPPSRHPPNQTGSVERVEGWRQSPFPSRWACLVSWPCSGRGRLTPQQTTGLHVTRALAPPYAPAKPRIHSSSSSLGERGTTVIQVQRPQLPGEYLAGRGTGVVFLGIGVGCRPLYACAWEALLFSPTHPPSQLLGGGHS